MTKYVPHILSPLIWPDPKLKTVSKKVTVFDKALENFAMDMFATMSALEGVGLSAPQVNRFEQIITIRIEQDKPMVIINPEVTVFSTEKFEWEEGCLSVPGYFKKGERPDKIAVTFNDVTGTEHTVQFGGLYSYAIQHEVDHLNGICFVDSISKFWHSKIKKTIKKALPEFEKKAAMARIQIEHTTQQ